MTKNKDEDFLNSPFDIDYYPFLQKESVQLQTEVEIINVTSSSNPLRPYFIGKFPFGDFKFDFCIEEMRRFIDIYGRIPQKWIGLKLLLKANPYKKRGFRLTFQSQ